MDEILAPIIDRIKEIIINKYSPELIILYGSAARGETDEFSDIDLMVILDHDKPEETATRMMADTEHIDFDKHIMGKSADEYIRYKDIPGTMVFSAVREGAILYKSPDFDADAVPLNSYEERKKDVIRKDYIEQSREFLEIAEAAAQNMQFFKCRDNLKFSIVRALKAVLVHRDIHPGRDIDLNLLYNMAWKLLPEVDTFYLKIKEINEFIPDRGREGDGLKCREMIGNTRFIVDRIAEMVEIRKLRSEEVKKISWSVT